ncbi:MAG: aspartate aminotransferase family protein [Saprospiraceae bacterium]|nr:aspartate aminotransferase family protein [Saprospiraceae bacterium]
MLRHYFFQHIAQTSHAPMALQIEKAHGLYLYDREGKAYLDLISGIGPSVLGHRHPYVQQAVEQQLNRYWHTLVYGEFVLAPQVQLATLLSDNLPAPLDSVYLVNSGAEATEGAMKLAKRYTGRTSFVACRRAYHGSTQGAASLMMPDDFTRAFRPLLPDIHHINFNEEADLSLITEQTAAVIVETIQGEAGIIPAKKAWLQALRQRCTATGALLILDEIQAGFGRTGRLFAFEHFDVIPDVLLLAKGFGGGMPLGAFVAPKAIMQTLSHDPVLGHITTFGGHPVSAAAGLATLEVLLQGDLLKAVPEKEARFRQNLQHPLIRELRSFGLWLAVDLGDALLVQRVIAHCIEQGVITDWFLFNDQSLRIAPPLTIGMDEIDRSCQIILEGLGDMG